MSALVKQKKFGQRGSEEGKNFISYNTPLNFNSYLSTNYKNVCVLASNYDKCKQGVHLNEKSTLSL
jgi:hypothetical protein